MRMHTELIFQSGIKTQK